MLICDNCNVCIIKHNFCCDKCRVQYHRNASVTEVKSTDTTKLVTETLQEEPEEAPDLGECQNYEATNGMGKTCHNPAIEVVEIANSDQEGNEWTVKANLCEKHHQQFLRETGRT